MSLASLLGQLPSRGLLTDGGSFTNPPAPFIAQYDTSPAHILETENSGILIATLTKRPKPKTRKSRRQDTTKPNNKRPLEDDNADEQQEDKAEGSNRQSKRAATTANKASEAGPSGSSPAIPKPHESKYTTSSLQSKTIKDLQSILRAWSLNISGRKDELITRIMSRQSIGHKGKK